MFGTQAVGTVVSVGASVDSALVGTRVVALPGYGAYAEYLVADADQVIRVPDDLDDAAAIATLMPGSVALALLDAAHVQAGETVLVEAAATGMTSGPFAFQAGRYCCVHEGDRW